MKLLCTQARQKAVHRQRCSTHKLHLNRTRQSNQCQTLKVIQRNPVDQSSTFQEAIKKLFWFTPPSFGKGKTKILLIAFLIQSYLVQIPAYYSLLQPIPAYFSIFHPIPAYSSLCQPISAYSSLIQPISAYFSLCQPIPAYTSLFQHIPAYSSLFHNVIVTIHPSIEKIL